ncbi:hypothetical protein VNO78_27193 [Psophocarpus tetragonolobus]|uniref:Protein kinase domain-containing protein n=1 Tax=Psophocarpus tetragonolobus TaxID=3891 RepID=A0AAN9S187_PSOTE
MIDVGGGLRLKGKLVGCGSFGIVHLAINKSTRIVFVVKSPYSKDSSMDGFEVLRNESLDFAADIWFLGYIVIEMTIDTPPWAHRVFPNPISVLLSIAHGDALPHFPPHFSNDGLNFLRRCLHKQPNKRFTAHQLLSHPFVSSQTSSPPNVF